MGQRAKGIAELGEGSTVDHGYICISSISLSSKREKSSSWRTASISQDRLGHAEVTKTPKIYLSDHSKS